MPEKKFEGQNNYGWGLTLNMTGKIPAINKRIFSTYQDAFEFANNVNDSAIKGLILSVIEDEEEIKNGLYYIQKIKTSNNDTNAILIKIPNSNDVNDLTTKVSGNTENITELQKITSGYTSTKTINSVIEDVQIQINDIKNTYATDDELATAISGVNATIASSKITLTEGTNGNVKVSKSTANGYDEYTVEGINLATTAITNEIDNRVKDIEEDYLTSGDKTELSSKIDAEASARTADINTINDKIDKLSDTYATDDELSNIYTNLESKISAAQIAATTKVIEGADSNENLTIAETTAEDGSKTYTFNLSNVAKADTLQSVDERIKVNELVVAASLNEMKNDINIIKNTYATTEDKTELTNLITNESVIRSESIKSVQEQIDDIELIIEDNELVVANAIAGLDNKTTNIATSITEINEKVNIIEENFISKTEGFTQIIESENEPSEEYRENYIWLQETDDDILLEDNTSIDIRQMYNCLVELTKLVRRHEYAFSHEMNCGTVTENNTRKSLMSEATPVPPDGYGDTKPIFITTLENNKSIEIIKDFYLKSEFINGITNATTGWTDILETPDDAKPYLWNYKKIIYNSENNQYEDISPILIGIYNDLRVIDSVKNYYAISNSNQQAPEINEQNWSENLPEFDNTKPYLWNYLNLKYIEDEDINKPSYEEEGFGGANVKHLTIKSSRTEQEIRDNIINLLDNELVWCEGNNGLYIKSKGKIVKINGSSENDDDNEIDDIMTGITFVNEGVSAIDFISTNGTKYTMKVNDNGNLKIYNNNLDIPHNPPTGDAAGTEGSNVSALFLEKLYINSLYCGGLVDNNGNEINEHSINPCSHNFVELSNLTTEDINLNGLSLQYASSGTNWKVLPLWGIIKAGSTFLIRGAQCSIMDLNTTVIKVKDYDMEWRDNDGSLIKFDNKSAKFYLTYGTSPCDIENPYILDTSSNTLKFRYGYIDLVGLSSINGNNIPEGQENKPYPYLNSNYLFRKYYAMDNVSQATKAKDKRNNLNDWYYIDLRRDDILPNIKDYTPRASSYSKNIFYDKSNLLDMKPTICTITFGIQATDNGNGATRCFTWVSKGYYDEYLWYRKKGETTWICNESIKNSTDDIEKYYNRICQEYTNGSVFTSHKLIIRGLEHGSYEYTCGKPSNNGSPDFEKCIEIREFVVRSNDELTNGYSFIQISDQQGFNWDEYQVWYYAAKYISENNNPHFLINTGDMTQNGNRLNEWIDYFNAKTPLNNLEEMATIGNNDLSPKIIYKLGDGGDSSKINFANINFFYTFEIDENNPSIFSHENIDYGYIPSIYSFNYGNTHFLCVNSEISEMTETNILGVEDNNKGIIYHLIKEWCQRDINFYSNYDWKIAYCHEMPFTIITDKVKSDFYNPKLNNGFEDETKNKRAGSRINTTTKPGDEYWFSRFCQDNGIRLVMGGHKHTQAITFPIRENIKGNGKVNSMKPIIEVTSNDLNEYFDGSTHLIEIIDESELNRQKFPNKWFIEEYQENTVGTREQLNPNNENDDCHFCTFELVESITAPIYSMSQSTGYKHTSNKELPAQKIPWCHYYYPSKKEETIDGNQSIITSTVNNGQKYPFYSIYTISENDISISVKKLENILISGKFNINVQGESIKTGNTVITVQNGLSPSHLTSDKKVVINK